MCQKNLVKTPCPRELLFVFQGVKAQGLHLSHSVQTVMKGTQIGMKIAVNHVLPALFYIFCREESVLDYQKLAYALLRVIAKRSA